MTDLEKDLKRSDGSNKSQLSGLHVWVDGLREEAPDLWGRCRVRFWLGGENVGMRLALWIHL